ncbi:MAG: lipopolysaccharide biosynthesis protein [Ruminococcaceae bacterium]|nr:lipopolysaccharide biosynthesis protein [Oscillospiraceae bacterium]
MKQNKVFSNFIWRFLERCGAQGIAFIVSIVLARILDPSVYGTVALVTVFTAILQVFIDSGMGNALIQKKNADDLDFSTVFYYNLAMCLLLYGILFFASPLIAKFYETPELTSIIRVLGLTVVVSGIKNIQQAYVSRNMMFKRFFFATLGGTIGAAVIGIIMAYNGFGVWALVAQHLFNLVIDTIILWITVKWRPKLMFSWERFKGLFSFGWKILVSGLLDTVYNNLRQLIIGKLYSKTDLAYFNKGKQFPNLIITNVNVSIDSVLLPSMSAAQDDKSRVRSMTRRAIKTSTYIMAPLMLGLAAVAETFISLLLTEKWLFCVPFLRVFCITYMFYPIHTANLNAIKAMGRSDLYLKLEIIKKVVGFAVLLSTMWFGVMAMTYSLLFTSVISQIINSWPNRKLLNYSYPEQLKDILPGILLALFMAVSVWSIGLIGLHPVITLIIQIISGAAIYILGSVLFGLESFKYLWSAVSTKLFKNKKIKSGEN